MKRWLILLFLLPIFGLSAQELWCPEPTNRLVNDYSGMLTAEQQEALESRLVAFDDSTSNQILVIITPSLHGCEIMELGTRIGTTWGVGQKDLKNGLVILIKSKTEEEPYGDVALVPGYGLEGALPDAFCKHIIDDEMIGPLGEGDYYTALVQALDVIEPVCRGEYSYADYKKEDRAALFALLGFMLLMVVILVLAHRYNKKHPGSGSDHFTGGSGKSSGPIRIRSFNHIRQVIGKHFVIAIHETHPFALCLINAIVTGSTNPRVLLMKHPDSRILLLIGITQCATAVSTAVIN